MSTSATAFFVVFAAIGLGTTMRIMYQAAVAILGRPDDEQDVKCVGCNPCVFAKGEGK